MGKLTAGTACVKLTTNRGLCPHCELRALLPLVTVGSQAPEGCWTLAQVWETSPVLEGTTAPSAAPVATLKSCVAPSILRVKTAPSPALHVLLQMGLP